MAVTSLPVAVKNLSIFVYIFTFSPFFFYVIQKYNSEYFYHKKALKDIEISIILNVCSNKN